MFDFFEELIEKLGVKLVSNFTDKLCNWIKNIKKSDEGSNNDNGRDYTKIGASGNDIQIGASGYGTKIGASGNDIQIGASGDGTQIGTSGDYTKIGASGNDIQIGASGYGTKIGASGNDIQIGASGDGTQIGTSGDYTKIGASGNDIQIGASGDGTQIGTSGDGTQIGASGNDIQIGASGDHTKIGASGDYTKIGASGDHTKIGASGDYTKIGASGDGTQIEISGNNSIGFACGYKTIIKAKRGTWISLAEYRRDDEGNIIPIFAKSAQIGNKEYKDHNGNMLKSNTYYTLYKKEFYAVDIYDGLKTIRLSEKKRDNITIIKAVDMSSILNDKVEEIYIAKDGKLTAHGYTVREAVEDLTLKKLGNVNVDKIVAQIKETGKVTRSQYRAITGACSFGTNKFCEEHNIQDLEEIEVSELRKILINDYGADKFWSLIDNTN